MKTPAQLSMLLIKIQLCYSKLEEFVIAHPCPDATDKTTELYEDWKQLTRNVDMHKNFSELYAYLGQAILDDNQAQLEQAQEDAIFASGSKKEAAKQFIKLTEVDAFNKQAKEFNQRNELVYRWPGMAEGKPDMSVYKSFQLTAQDIIQQMDKQTQERNDAAINSFLGKVIAQNPYLNFLDYTLCTQPVIENGITYTTYWLAKRT